MQPIRLDPDGRAIIPCHYRCQKCGREWIEPTTGPVTCVCGWIYCDWLNAENVLELLQRAPYFLQVYVDETPISDTL